MRMTTILQNRFGNSTITDIKTVHPPAGMRFPFSLSCSKSSSDCSSSLTSSEKEETAMLNLSYCAGLHTSRNSRVALTVLPALCSDLPEPETDSSSPSSSSPSLWLLDSSSSSSPSSSEPDPEAGQGKQTIH